jgi:hypothetical protein
MKMPEYQELSGTDMVCGSDRRKLSAGAGKDFVDQENDRKSALGSSFYRPMRPHG